MALPYEWARKALNGEPIEASPFGKGITEGRSFGVEHPYATDSAACVASTLEAPKLGYPLYNVSTGHRVSLHEMVDAIRETFPDVRFVEPIPQGDASIASRASSLDVSRMRDDLGFEPRYDLVSALKDYLEWRRTFGFLE
jgi:UDP-glucose 4-epimerase